ncbi:MMPL family transporter [Candidatus Saccharibacteria bacterium]|nr:MMPL family transporter [Candidatus Saccharibacteria bacterium]MBH2007390.1 MMPL family transporter [Candidatus Saccharibacteria bacterium]
MGNFLLKLGGRAFELKWAVIAIWLVILAGLGGTALYYMKPMSSSISIPGTEAQKTFDRYGELFPDEGKGSGRIVFSVEKGASLDNYKQPINELLAKIKGVDNVTGIVNPFDNPYGVTDDRRIGYAVIQMEGETGSISQTTTDKIETLTKDAATSGLEINRGGDLNRKVPDEILGIGEIAGVLIALMVLVITLGSLVAAGMPLITALVAVGASAAGLFSLSQVIDINSTTPALAVMLGLAVGIDYSLFIINRYRSLLLEGYDYKTAASRAIATAGSAVLFAAATVVIALSSLVVIQIPFMTTMGLTAAATVAAAAIIAVTLIPAMLGIAGSRIFRGKTRQRIIKAQKIGVKHNEHAPHTSRWWKWGNFLTKYPYAIIAVCVLAIAIVAYPAKDMKLGLPTDEYAAVGTTERRAYDLLAEGFGSGFNGPLLVLVENMPATSDADREAVRKPIMDEFNKRVATEEAAATAQLQTQAAQITSPEEYMAFEQQVAAAQAEGEQKKQAALSEVEKQIDSYAPLYKYNQIANRIAKLDNVKQALPAATAEDGKVGVIQVIPKTGPSDQATTDLVASLRDVNSQQDFIQHKGATIGVTGATAMQIDINKKLADALPIYLAVVVGLSLVLLVVAFRSILVPLKATLGFLLSVAAMFGALVAVFQWGWFGIAEAPGPIVSMIPIIAIGILFGLAMDYEFFLVSGMHEAHNHTRDAHKAVLRGFHQGAAVVVAAGAIMVSVFAGFITNHDTTIQALGFALTIGILVDAFIVRMTIVPAVMQLLGSSAWWLPKWLDRLLPHIAIEGEAKHK